MTKPTKWHVRQAKTQFSLGIRPVRHPPSLIRVFAAVHMKKHWALNYLLSAKWRLWSDWADARLIWVFTGCIRHFVCFVMWQLISMWKSPLVLTNGKVISCRDLMHWFCPTYLIGLAKVNEIILKGPEIQNYIQSKIWSLINFLVSVKPSISVRGICFEKWSTFQAFALLLFLHFDVVFLDMSRLMTKPTEWPVAQSDQSLHCLHEESLGP